MVKLEKSDWWYYIINAILACFVLTAYIIGGIYFFEACNGSIISLGAWLIIFAILETLYLIGIIILVCCLPTGNKTKIKIIGVYINCLLLLIWAIVGLFDIFWHAFPCITGAFTLWSGSLVMVIFMAAYIIASMLSVDHKIFCQK